MPTQDLRPEYNRRGMVVRGLQEPLETCGVRCTVIMKQPDPAHDVVPEFADA